MFLGVLYGEFERLCTMCTPVSRVKIQKTFCGAWFEMYMYMKF